MKTVERHMFLVRSANAPTVDIDFESRSVYVRFKKAKVAKTVARQTSGLHLAVDLDSKGEVIGIEGVGAAEIELAQILQRANVQVPNIDLSKAVIRQTPAMACT